MSASWQLDSSTALELDRPRLMGILNMTPDSFSDGGRYGSVSIAVDRVMQMCDEGADLIDVGGESTRPGSDRVAAAEQIDRVIPVIKAIRSRSEVPVSVDTTLAEVAAAALDAGAQVINDVSAGREDPDLFLLAADRGCGLILMHRLVPPGEDSYSTSYDQPPDYKHVVEEVAAFLSSRTREALEAGVRADSVVVDPGLGFGKSVDQNWDLIHGSSRLSEQGCPVLGAASRKSFLERLCGPGVAPADRGPASVMASIIQYRGGVRLFRVHDVALHAAGLGKANSHDRGSS